MKRIILMATLCAAAASLAAGLRSSYTSPKWVMGGAARSSASVLATTAALAFPDMKLVDVQELLSQGYVFGAWQCGTSMIRRALQAKDVLICRDPDTDAVVKIVGVFSFVDDKYTKSIAFELTDGAVGVYARGARAQYVGGSQPDFVFAELNGNGGVTYSCDSANSPKATPSTVAGWENGGYGACGLSIVKVPPKDAPALIWANEEGKPALTLDDIKDNAFSGTICGVSTGPNSIGQPINAYNKSVAVDGEGKATLIRLEFQYKEDGHVKCTVVELTNGDGGVYGQSTKSVYKDGVEVGYRFVNDDGTMNAITGESVPGFYGQAGAISGANSTAGYGVCALHVSAVQPVYRSKMFYGSDQHIQDVTKLPCVPGGWTKVFDDVTLQELKDGEYEFSGWFCGGFTSSKQLVFAQQFETFTPADETSVSNALCVFNIYDTGSPRHTKSVAIELETRDDGVWARHARGQYLNNQNNVNFKFAWLDENGKPTFDCDQSSHTANGNNNHPASWTDGGYGLAGLKASKYMKKNESLLVWANPAGEPVLTLDDVKDRYLGCYFASAHISGKNGEGMGMYKAFEYDGDSLRSMRVEFQIYDGGWNKAVIVNFTNGVDGVYGCAVAAGHANANSNKVGFHFVNASGGFVNAGDTVAVKYNEGGYGIFDLFAAPMVTLAEDEDWSGRGGALQLGGSVIDLNGHSLAVDGVTGDESVYAKIVNFASEHTAELRCKPARNIFCSNSSVYFGKSEFVNNNIKFVKDGDGVYVASISQTYTGGTELAGGTLKPNINGSSRPFGAIALPIPIAEGAVLDMYGCQLFQDYSFTIAGGTIRSTHYDYDHNNAMLKNVSLAADSSIDIVSSYGMVGNGHTPTTIDLAGHALAVDVTRGKMFLLCNTEIKNGSIDLRSGGWLQTGSDAYAPASKENTATNVDFRVNCALRLYATLSVRDYEAVFDQDFNAGSAALNVYGTFKPAAHDRFYGCTLQDGSTIDFTARTTPLPLVANFTDGEKTLKFADGAVVNMKFGESRPSAKGPIISWTPETKPANIGSVKFKCVNATTAKYSFVAKDDGLYVLSGLVVFVR